MNEAVSLLPELSAARAVLVVLPIPPPGSAPALSDQPVPSAWPLCGGTRGGLAGRLNLSGE